MITTLISGGQTGADQAGLFAGRALGLETGGWVPRGWRTDDGPAPWLAGYGCREHTSAAYAPRTQLNVEQSDATILFGSTVSPGSRLTLWLCRAAHKPHHVFTTVPQLRAFLAAHPDLQVLNIAGNRERTYPGIHQLTLGALTEALRP